jgi:hypothetical protein
VWTSIKGWLALQDVDPTSWHGWQNVKDWWSEVIHKQGQSKKAMTSLAIYANILGNLEEEKCPNLSKQRLPWLWSSIKSRKKPNFGA